MIDSTSAAAPPKQSALGAVLLVSVVLEAALFGSGRMLEAGGLTLRMWLFAACQVYVLFLIIGRCRRLTVATTIVLSSFTAILTVGVVAGFVGNASSEAIVEDLKPLLYVFALVFFELAIVSESQLRLVVRLLKASSVAMAGGYVAVAVLLFAGVIPFPALYAVLSSLGAEDFMFRGDGGAFFYKGAIYIGVGMILFAFEHGWKARVALCIGLAGLLATGTRGLFLGLGVVMMLHLGLSGGGILRRLRYGAMIAALAGGTYLWFSSAALDRSRSDYVRVLTLTQVSERMTPASLILGHGFGIGVPEKPVHMEIAYLEIFHKQGLLGVAWWIGLLGWLGARYRRAHKMNSPYAEALFLCALFVAVVSMTNPFINNPIGMTICLIAIVGLDVRSRATRTSEGLETAAA